MAARSKARKRAVDILFEADQRGVDVLELLRERLANPGQVVTPEYAVTLVEGVVGHRERIDEALSTYSQGWPLERMPSVDRAILRVAVEEIVWSEDIPDPVAISEAVNLATSLSTDDSPAFVNGLLSRIASVKATLA